MEAYLQESEDLRREPKGQKLKTSGHVSSKVIKERLFEKDSQIQNYTEISGSSKTPDMWTSLVADFRAKTLALRERWKELPERDLGYGVKCLEFVGWLDQGTSSLKTAQLSLFEDSKKSYATFPKSGIMQNGNVSRTSLLDSLIGVKGSMLLPTPTKSDHKATFARIEALTRYLESGHQIRLMDMLCQKGFTKCQRVQILEMVMGFDIGHTELDPAETP